MSFKIHESHPVAIVTGTVGSNITQGPNVEFAKTLNMVVMTIKEHEIAKASGAATYQFITVPNEFLPGTPNFEFIGQYNTVSGGNIFRGIFNNNNFVFDFDINGADTSFAEATIKDQTVTWTQYDPEGDVGFG